MWTVLYILILAALAVVVGWELTREPLIPTWLVDPDDDDDRVELDEAA